MSAGGFTGEIVLASGQIDAAVNLASLLPPGTHECLISAPIGNVLIRWGSAPTASVHHRCVAQGEYRLQHSLREVYLVGEAAGASCNITCFTSRTTT